MPTLLYGLMWSRNNQAGYTYTELLCIYGYSLSIYIPISVRKLVMWMPNTSYLFAIYTDLDKLVMQRVRLQEFAFH